MGDDDESNDIFNVRSLQAAAATCQFKVPVGAPIYEDPCDISCDYSTDNSLSTECENAIYNHCKANYRIDNLACADFNDIILGGGMCNYDKLPKSAIDALATGITEGRNGKGVIFVFASGNKFFEGDDINMSAWTNSRYTITVGAVGKDGKHADYSTRKLYRTTAATTTNNNKQNIVFSVAVYCFVSFRTFYLTFTFASFIF